MTDPLAAVRLAAALAVVAVVPGAAALRLAGHPSRGLERLALAVGASVVVWPLVLLWSTLAGWRWSPATLGIGLTMAGVWLAAGTLRRARHGVGLRRQAVDGRPPDPSPAFAARAPRLSRTAPEPAAAVAILAIAMALRVWQARDLVAPAWVDGLHHTLVAQLIADTGAVPSGYRPYLAVDGFYYHFGFHALAAAVAWLADTPARWAVLWTGQALGAAAALTTYAAALRLVRRPAAALLAAAVPASLFWFPAYFVSWARYTQLAGLVALPVVWALVADAVRPPDASDTGGHAGASGAPARRAQLGPLALAAAASAGLVLVHYRVSVFFGLGVAAAVAAGLVGRTSGARAPLGRLALVACAALALAAPWALRHLAPGMAALASVSPDWARGPAETVDAIGLSAGQGWLFTQGTSGFWQRLAWAGWLLAAWRGRRAAWAVGAGLAAAMLLVAPGWIGLAASWMLPPFALAISLYLPVAWGAAWWLEAVVDAAVAGAGGTAPRARAMAVAGGTLTAVGAWAARGAPGWLAAALGGAENPWTRTAPSMDGAWPAVAQVAGAALVGWALRRARPGSGPPERRGARLVPAFAVVGIALVGAWRMRDIVNPRTVIVEAADVAAADWIRANTPPSARFVVATAPWHLGTYRGLDGGYWLPLLAGRTTTMPPALYTYGAPAAVHAVNATAAVIARGDGLDDARLATAMAASGAEYIYVGPASRGTRGAFTAARLRRAPGLVAVYERDGVAIFRRRGPAGE